MNKIKQTNKAGFTLIELVVAILIFAIGIVGIMKMHQASIQSNNYSMQLTEALGAAETRLELLRGLSFSHTSMSIGAHTETVVSLRGIPYTVNYTVTDSGSTATATRTIALNVQWDEKATHHEVDFAVMRDDPIP